MKKNPENNKNSDSGSTSTTPTSVEKIDKIYLRQSYCGNNYPWGPPKYKDKEQDSAMVFVCKEGFAVGFNKDLKIPVWATEVVQARNLLEKITSRTDNFSADPVIPSIIQANNADYGKSGFDRGHLVPAENVRYSQQTMIESFYFTNIVPQVGPNMNRGIWLDIENWVRAQAKQREFLYTVSGPMFIGKMNKLGSGVAIPTHLYKIVIDPQLNEAISFIIPNVQIITQETRELSTGTPQYPQTLAKNAYNCADKGKTFCSMLDFTVPIVEVERLTGLRFISDTLESNEVRYKVSAEFFVNRRKNGVSSYGYSGR